MMSNTHRLKSLIAIASIGLMAGCAQNKVANEQTVEQKAQQAAIGAQLDAALDRVSKQPRWSTSLDDKASFASFATDSVSVSYQGSAADLLKAVAASRGVSFKVTGPAPHIPVFVFVEAEGQKFAEFLRDLDKQMGQRARVVWSDKGFELRYRQ